MQLDVLLSNLSDNLSQQVPRLIESAKSVCLRIAKASCLINSRCSSIPSLRPKNTSGGVRLFKGS